MGLDIYIFGPGAFCTRGPNGSFLRRASEYICSFDNKGYYWFFFSLFKDLAKQTGQQIDLYGTAVFDDTTLDALAQTLNTAHRLVEAQPDLWEVRTGVRMKPLPIVEVRATIDKKLMITWLEKLEGEVLKAKSTGEYITFEGD